MLDKCSLECRARVLANLVQHFTTIQHSMEHVVSDLQCDEAVGICAFTFPNHISQGQISQIYFTHKNANTSISTRKNANTKMLFLFITIYPLRGNLFKQKSVSMKNNLKPSIHLSDPYVTCQCIIITICQALKRVKFIWHQ